MHGGRAWWRAPSPCSVALPCSRVPRFGEPGFEGNRLLTVEPLEVLAPSRRCSKRTSDWATPSIVASSRPEGLLKIAEILSLDPLVYSVGFHHAAPRFRKHNSGRGRSFQIGAAEPRNLDSDSRHDGSERGAAYATMHDLSRSPHRGPQIAASRCDLDIVDHVKRGSSRLAALKQ